MSIVESVGVAGFLMAIVFLVLVALFLCVRLFSYIIAGIERRFAR